MVKVFTLLATLVATGLAALAFPIDLAPPSVAEDLQISAPRGGAIVDGPDVVVSGYANNGTVTVRVYRGTTRVYSGTPAVRNGRWQTGTLKLGNGAYSATAEQGKSIKRVSFTVGASKGFGFLSPENGASLAGPNVTVQGTADSGTVILRFYRGSELLVRKEVGAQNGRWTYTMRFEVGSYRVEAEHAGAKRTIGFRVGSGGSVSPGNSGGTGAESELPIDIDSPRDGATVSGPDVTISGHATEDTISLRLYDGKEIVLQAAVEVRNGHWSLTRRMSQGTHSVVVQQKQITRTVTFHVGFRSPNSGTINPVKPADRVAVSAPRGGANVKGPRVTFSGTASTPSVGVYIYQGNKRVYESSQKVVRGRWSFSTDLKKNGAYRLEITAGTGHATMSFKVK